jgi:hypothetical protein
MRIASGVIGLLVPAVALGWSAPGHRIIAAIAEEHLTPRARQFVAEMVGDVPISAPEIAAWADAQRNRATRSWHYANIPLTAGRYDAARDCPDGNCIVAAIDRAISDLADSKSLLRRADGLRWLVHLVGDIHQPLHVGDPWDRGGNTFRIRLGRRKQPSHLHRVWDDDVVKPLLRRYGDLSSAARGLAAAVMPADAIRWTRDLDVAHWAGESSQEARAIYAELDRKPTDATILTLPRDYAEAEQQRVERQLQRAGVRLAALLDRIAQRRQTGK